MSITASTEAVGPSCIGSPALAAWLGEGEPLDVEADDLCGSASDASLRVVVRSWSASGAHTGQTLDRMGEVAIRFVGRVTATGVGSLAEVTREDCERFINARTRHGEAPSNGTRHFRRTTIRTVFRTLRSLGAELGDPTLDITLPPRGTHPARPLTDDEITLCRTAVALRGPGQNRAAAALALAEATAHTAEIPRISAAHLDDPLAPATVQLPGTRRAEPRLGHLTTWGAVVLAARVAATSGPLTYSGRAPAGSVSPHAATCRLIAGILHGAGLDAEPDVRPVSIRNWAGRALHDSGVPIEETARRLGLRSLDATADAIGLDWRDR